MTAIGGTNLMVNYDLKAYLTITYPEGPSLFAAYRLVTWSGRAIWYGLEFTIALVLYHWYSFTRKV